jgi:multiple sugar transport system permease protein
VTARCSGNSVIVGIAATVLTLLLGTMCAYALSRFKFPGRNSLAFSTLLVRTLPPAVLAIPLYFLWGRLGLGDSLGGLILAYVALNLPFTIWLLYGFLEQVPLELEEAAIVDGAGPLRLFFTIILPLVKPGLAAAAIFTFRIAWNEPAIASVLTNCTTRTAPYAVYLFITSEGIECFGGPKRNRLYITAQTSLYAIYVNTLGGKPCRSHKIS